MTEAIQRTDASASGADDLSHASRLRAMFSALDNRDFDTMAGYLTKDVVVQFANNPELAGVEALFGLFEQVMGALKGIRHEIHDIWRAAEDPDLIIARMTVHYTRLDGVVISTPCCNLFRLGDGLIADYRVYVDASPVFA